MARYYILKRGKKAFAETMQDIQRMAQAEADRLGRAIMIYSEDRTPTRKVYKKNPSKTIYSVSYYVPEERYWQLSGEFDTKSEAYKRFKYLENRGHKVRVRKR
jgi:hypothetical protein